MIFIKFFDKESYADDFMKGDMYCQRVKEFKKIESEQIEYLRKDPHEGVHSFLKVEKDSLVQLIVDDNVKYEFKAEVTTPLYLSNNFDNHCPIFCMFSLNLDYLNECEIDQKSQKIYAFDNRLSKFGDFAVIISDPQKLFQRVRILERQKETPIEGSHVKYINANNHHGLWGFFKKAEEFSYQSEYRFVFQKPISSSAIKYNIGDISSFTKKIKTSELDTISFKEYKSDKFLKLCWKE